MSSQVTAESDNTVAFLRIKPSRMILSYPSTTETVQSLPRNRQEQGSILIRSTIEIRHEKDLQFKCNIATR